MSFSHLLPAPYLLPLLYSLTVPYLLDPLYFFSLKVTLDAFVISTALFTIATFSTYDIRTFVSDTLCLQAVLFSFSYASNSSLITSAKLARNKDKLACENRWTEKYIQDVTLYWLLFWVFYWLFSVLAGTEGIDAGFSWRKFTSKNHLGGGEIHGNIIQTTSWSSSTLPNQGAVLWFISRLEDVDYSLYAQNIHVMEK